MASIFEKRKNERYDDCSTLEYSIAHKRGQVSRTAIIINISLAGLCLYLFEPLAVGEKIIIKKSTLPMPHSEATVRWIQRAEIGDDIYKAGLEFCSSQ